MKVTADIEVVVNPRFRPATKEAMTSSLRMAGVIFASSAKHLTTVENHVVTGRYRASIGARGSADGIFTFSNNFNVLDVGSNVFYSVFLEDRFNLLARGLDQAMPRIQTEVARVFVMMLESRA